MSAKKDMRRTDLVVPYVEPPKDKENDFGSTFSSTMPMAAMFMRNRLLGWFSLLTAVLSWLAETPGQKDGQTTPGYLSVGMALLAIAVTYMPLFLPPPPQLQAGLAPPAPPASSGGLPFGLQIPKLW